MNDDDLDLADLDDIDLGGLVPEAEDDEVRGRCPDCGGRYWGERGNHCRGGRFNGCCRTYYGLRAFDAHRPGRKCRTTAELAADGWTRDDNGWWRMPAGDGMEDDE